MPILTLILPEVAVIFAKNFLEKLDAPLLQVSRHDRFTLRDAAQGVHIFGGVGSGKTSGSGQALASAYLRAGWGGLVLVAKPDETDRWLAYARANGRANSVVVFGERGGGGFNFLSYEMARQGAAGIGSVVECLMRILDASRLAHGNTRPGEQFWEDTTRQLLRNTLPVLYAATGNVRIPDIIRFIASAPASQQLLREQSWQEGSFMYATLVKARTEPLHPLPEHEFRQIAGFWHDEYAGLDPKLRGSIAMSISTTLDRFNRGRLYEHFCTQTTLVPEMTFHGAIIIMDMSALTWNEDGIVAQQLFKFMWQRAVLSRNALEPRHRERPVFLWADESQYFCNSFDADYQSTCRSSLGCTVYLTQSLPTYYARIGGEQAKHRADMLLATFATKVFHNNACPETNRWAADTLGRILQRRVNFSEGESYGRNVGMSDGESTSWGSSFGTGSSTDGRGNRSSSSNAGWNRGGGENLGRSISRNTGGSTSQGYSEVMDYVLEPGSFSRMLLTGGEANGGKVSAVWFQAGRKFKDSSGNALYVTFRQ